MKKVSMVLGGVLLLIALGAAVFLVSNNDDDTATTQDTSNASQDDTASEETRIDSLGLCDIIDTDNIKTALGAVASSLQGPDDTGTVNLGDSDLGQTCVYSLGDAGSVSNSFYIDLAQYTTQETFDEVSQYSDSGTRLDDIGDVAYFEASDTLIDTKEFSLKVFKATKIYSFVISQPNDAVTFDAASAQKALTEIARTATL